MALDMKHSLRLQQQLKLTITPQLQQAIKLLQLTRLELQQTIKNELEQNPVLEEILEEETVQKEAVSTEEKVKDNPEEADSFLDSINLDAYFPDEAYGKYQASRARAEEDGRPLYENTLRTEVNLTDHLIIQLSLENFSLDEKKIGTYLIGNIDENGYLKVSLDEIAEKFQSTLPQVEGVLKKVQIFDPTGVGARDLQECLSIQAREKFGTRSLEVRILNEYFDKFIKTDLLGVARALKIEKTRVKTAFKNLAGLDPKPGRRFSSPDVHYVLPDISVFKVGPEWVISLNEDGLPKLRINSYYRNLIKQKDSLSREEKEYLREKVNSAVWFVKSIYQRKRTIYRVMESILKNQIDFFEQGPGHLKPLTLRDIAEDIEMHESTVSRVTSGKYVHTPLGLFELKYFFTSSLSKRDGESVASESVKEKIKELIKGENPEKPLSDIEVARILKSQGINIARRTVTKYRESLGILPSNKRKKIF
jgi:RNA polymerase sigma-54 factor